jgi:hypothetical protein
VVDALQLRPGDHILIGPGRIERVRARSTRDKKWPAVVTVHTDATDILTTLPCPVKVVEHGGRR